MKEIDTETRNISHLMVNRLLTWLLWIFRVISFSKWYIALRKTSDLTQAQLLEYPLYFFSNLDCLQRNDYSVGDVTLISTVFLEQYSNLNYLC